MNRWQGSISPTWNGWLIVLFWVNLLVKTVPLFRGIMIHPDAPVYLWAAQSLEQGNIPEAITAHPMLFYPFFVMCVHWLGLDWLAAGRAVSVAASALALLPFWGLAKRFSPGWPCLIATLLFMLLPEYNSIAFAAIRDPLYICLALCAVYAAVRFAEGRELRWFLFGLLAAFCLPWLRVEGIALFLVIAAWSTVVLFRRFSIRGRLWASGCVAAVFCILFFLFSLSATGRNLLRLDEAVFILGKLRTTPPAVSYYLTVLDELAHNRVPSGFGNNFWQVIERNWQWIYAIGMLRMFENNLSWLLVLLGFFGIRMVMRVAGSGVLLPAIFGANMLVILASYLYAGSMEGRIMLFPAILWLFFVGAALPAVAGYLAEKVRVGSDRMRQHAVIMPLGLLLTLPFAWQTAFMEYNIHIPVLRDACLWVRDHVLHDGSDWKVIVNIRTAAWFLDKRDAEQIAPYNNKQMISALLDQDRPVEKATVLVLLLSRRSSEDTAAMESLNGLRGGGSRIFTDPADKKYWVLALWQKKEGGEPSW